MGHRFQFSLGALADDVDDDLVEDWSDLEDILELVESAGRSVHAAGRELRLAAPGAVRGALTGFAMGGPVGAGIGAVAGGVGSRRQATAATGALVAGPGSILSGLPGQPGANAAASQLLAALLRPEVVQALGAMALGPAGAASVPVAGTHVPVAAFANLVATLATQAAAHQHAAMSPAVAVPAYLAGVANPTSPIARADALLELLADAELDETDLDETDLDETDLDEADLDEAASADALANQRDLEDLDRLGSG